MNNDTSFDIIQESNPVQTVAQPKEDNEMLRATDRITALYCRLSVEDTKEDKKNSKEDLSNSIQNQKSILLQYARDHRFPHPTFFIDDGYSGVDFANRPGFQKMLAEIEAGNVGTVITKDLSRLGRNSSLTGLYINYTFPQNDVRYIAINDHFDSINPNSTDSDIAGIKNWFKKRLAQAEKRIGELDRLFIKIYEDNAKGNLSDERFAMMSKTYEDEQAQLKVEIVNLQKEVEVQERQIENLEQFIQRVRRYTTLTELTPYALRELVKAVYVEAPDKSSGKRKQKVHIEYDLVGYIPVDELIKAEQA